MCKPVRQHYLLWIIVVVCVNSELTRPVGLLMILLKIAEVLQ